MLFEKPRLWWYRRRLRQAARNARSGTGIPEANPGRSILILYDCTEQKSRTAISRFVEELRAEGKEVDVLGFFYGSLPEDRQFLPHEVITKKDLNWWRGPKSHILRSYRERSRDLLFNLDLGGSRPLHYVAAASRCHLKVGKSGMYPDIYHLMLEVDPEVGISAFVSRLKSVLQAVRVPAAS